MIVYIVQVSSMSFGIFGLEGGGSVKAGFMLFW